MLPDRHQKVYEGVVRGESDEEIARTLHVSPRTLRGFLSAIAVALGSDGKPRRAILRHHNENNIRNTVISDVAPPP